MTSIGLSLERTVCSLCPQIEAEQMRNHNVRLSERALWGNAVLDILSSQVPYEMAAAACRHLSASQLLPPFGSADESSLYERALRVALCAPFAVRGTWRKYRFPKTKARQIASTWRRINESGKTLEQIVYSGETPHTIRDHLLCMVSGFGPKQASMFLRDCGVASDLAIIDRHVIKYMETLHLICKSDAEKFTASLYRKVERAFAEYADFLGYSVGCVDRAIWVVMRVAPRGILACA